MPPTGSTPPTRPFSASSNGSAGVKIARVTQDIQAVAATAEVAAALGVKRRSPCLRILRCYIDESGRVIEISASHHPGDRFAYAMHIEVEG